MGPNGVPMSEGRPDQTEALNQIVSQLRDHLEHTAHVERLRHEQVERTKDLKRNVIIRIDKKERKRTIDRQKPKEAMSHFDISRISHCCVPMSSRTTSYETPLTNASTNSVADLDSQSFLQSGTSGSMQTKDMAESASSQDKESDALDDLTFDDEKEKELLRLKSDILSTCSSNAGDGSTSTDGLSLANFTDTLTVDDNYSLESTFEVTAQRSYPIQMHKKKDESTEDEEEGEEEEAGIHDIVDNSCQKDSDKVCNRKDIYGKNNTPSTLQDSLEKSGRSVNETRRMVLPMATVNKMESCTMNAQEKETPSDRILQPLLLSSSTSSPHDAHADETAELDVISSSKTNQESEKFSLNISGKSKDNEITSQDEKCLSSKAHFDENVVASYWNADDDTRFNHIHESLAVQSIGEVDLDESTFEISYDEGMGIIFDDEDAESMINCKTTQTTSDDNVAEEIPSISIDDGSECYVVTESVDLKQRCIPEEKALVLVDQQREKKRKEERTVLLDRIQDITSEQLVLENDAEGAVVDSTVAPFLVASATLSDMSEDAANTISETLPLVKKVAFIHGSFAAAAPFIMHDLKWKRILRKVMPNAHAKVVAQLKKADGFSESSQVAQMMKWAENNPVVAAYGIISNNYANPKPDPSTPIASNGIRHAQEIAQALSPPVRPSQAQLMPPLEWNVFLDPLIVADLEKAIDQSSRFRRVTDSEVERHVNRLVKRLILSHGTPHQLLSEAMGVYRSFTFATLAQAAGSENVESSKSQVGKTRSDTDEIEIKMPGVDGSNAIFVTQWLARFASAIHLGANTQNKSIQATRKMEKEEDNLAQVKSMVDITQPTGQPYCGMLLCVGYEDENSLYTDDSDSSFGVSAKIISRHIGSPLRVALNLKSRNISPRIWAHLVDFMRKHGVWVESIISFDAEELQSIADIVEKPVKQFRMFHSAGDLQAACHNGEVQSGDCVFFNAASLLATDQDKISAFVCGTDVSNEEIAFADYSYPKSAMSVRERRCMASIEDYKKKYRLNIGCYIQEHTVSANTVEALTDFFNQYSSLYNLGFAYGGVNGRVAIGLTGDGFSKQRFLGREWDDSAKPQSSMRVLNPWHSQIVNKISRAGGWGQLGTVNDGGVRNFF